MAELVTLPGVGVTANVILGNASVCPASRWTPISAGWSDGGCGPRRPIRSRSSSRWVSHRAQRVTLLSHRVIFHGRRVCHARKPACGICVLAKDCPSYGTGPTDPLVAADLVRGPETDHLLALAGPVGRCAPRPVGRFWSSPSSGRWFSDSRWNFRQPRPARDLPAPDGRTHRDADTPEALAGPRQRADLAPCPADGPGRVRSRCGSGGGVRCRRIAGRRRPCPG